MSIEEIKSDTLTSEAIYEPINETVDTIDYTYDLIGNKYKIVTKFNSFVQWDYTRNILRNIENDILSNASFSVFNLSSDDIIKFLSSILYIDGSTWTRASCEELISRLDSDIDFPDASLIMDIIQNFFVLNISWIGKWAIYFKGQQYILDNILRYNKDKAIQTVMNELGDLSTNE